MKKHIILSILSILCSAGFSQAGILREDIPEVVEKSKKAAKQFNSVGRISFFTTNQKVTIVSGIAIDPRTVLTAAHPLKHIDESSIILFSTDSRYGVPDGHTREAHSSNVIILDDYQRLSQSRTGQQSTSSRERILEELAVKSVDLAIIKLDYPLPAGLNYPKLWYQGLAGIKQLGFTVGYGSIVLNGADKPVAENTKHLYYSMVSFGENKSSKNDNIQLLYSSQFYQFASKTKNFKVIPQEMHNLEGGGYFGDSGAPHFMTMQGETHLVGIMSGCRHFQRTSSLKPGEFDFFIDYWVPIQKHILWIKSYMEDPGDILEWLIPLDVLLQKIPEKKAVSSGTSTKFGDKP